MIATLPSLKGDVTLSLGSNTALNALGYGRGDMSLSTAEIARSYGLTLPELAEFYDVKERTVHYWSRRNRVVFTAILKHAEEMLGKTGPLPEPPEPAKLLFYKKYLLQWVRDEKYAIYSDGMMIDNVPKSVEECEKSIDGRSKLK